MAGTFCEIDFLCAFSLQRPGAVFAMAAATAYAFVEKLNQSVAREEEPEVHGHTGDQPARRSVVLPSHKHLRTMLRTGSDRSFACHAYYCWSYIVC